jgi:hypothetical protein
MPRQPRNYETTATFNGGNLQSQVDRAYQQGKDDRTSGRAKRSIGVSYQWAYNAGWKDAGKPVAAQGVA